MISRAQQRCPTCTACCGTGHTDVDGVKSWLLTFVLICSRNTGSDSSLSECSFCFSLWQIKLSTGYCESQLVTSKGLHRCNVTFLIVAIIYLSGESVGCSPFIGSFHSKDFDLSSRKSTGVINNINNGCVPFSLAHFRALVQCTLTHWSDFHWQLNGA